MVIKQSTIQNTRYILFFLDRWSLKQLIQLNKALFFFESVVPVTFYSVSHDFFSSTSEKKKHNFFFAILQLRNMSTSKNFQVIGKFIATVVDKPQVFFNADKKTETNALQIAKHFYDQGKKKKKNTLKVDRIDLLYLDVNTFYS